MAAMNMEEKKVRIGVLSYAHAHQQTWCKVFTSRPDACVTAVWDDDEARGRRQAEALGVEYHRDVEQLLRRSDVDAVTICAENAKHAALAVAAAEHGKHIMMQKPMATSVAEAERIVAAVKKNGVKYMQAHNLRFDPIHTTIKKLVEEGRIGKVSMIRRRHSHHFAIDPGERERVLGWMTDPAQSGGGALMDEGAHAILWFLWMCGRPHSVTARMSTVTSGLKVEDNAMLLFDFPGGSIGCLQTSWTETAGDATIEIFGDRGVIIASGTDIASSRALPDLPRPLRLYNTDKGSWEYPEVELVKSRPTPPANAFIDYLKSEGPSPIDVDTAALAIKIAMSAYESAQTGRTITI